MVVAGVGACETTVVCGVGGAPLEPAGVGGGATPAGVPVGGAAVLTTEVGVAMVKAAAGGVVVDAWEAPGAADGVAEAGGAGRGAGAAAAAAAAATGGEGAAGVGVGVGCAQTGLVDRSESSSCIKASLSVSLFTKRRLTRAQLEHELPSHRRSRAASGSDDLS